MADSGGGGSVCGAEPAGPLDEDEEAAADMIGYKSTAVKAGGRGREGRGWIPREHFMYDRGGPERGELAKPLTPCLAVPLFCPCGQSLPSGSFRRAPFPTLGSRIMDFIPYGYNYLPPHRTLVGCGKCHRSRLSACPLFRAWHAVSVPFCDLTTPTPDLTVKLSVLGGYRLSAPPTVRSTGGTSSEAVQGH